MSVIGIDLGFQTSTVATPRSGGIEVLLNEYSKRASASWVSLTDKNRELGDAGKQKATTNIKNTLGNFKHLIGRNFADADVQASLAKVPYKTEAMEDGGVGFKVNYCGEQRTYSVTQIVGMLLTKIRSVAETELKCKVTDCCISVPSYFNDRQRHATLAAAKLAGLNCLKLFNETAAVALAYGIYKQDLPAEGETPRRVVFVDVGHSQTQMSACSLVKGKLTVEAVAARKVGGRDLDLLLVEHFAEEFKTKKKIDVKNNPRAILRLEAECEKLKKLMSANSTPVPINIECLMDDTDVSGKMAREDFEALVADEFAKIKGCAEDLLAQLKAGDDKFKLADIEFVEIVGGSVRIPKIKEILTEVFGKELSTTLNLDEAVARGCALEGAIKSPTFRVRDFTISDRTMYSVNLSWKNPLEDANDEGDNASDAEVFKANSKMSMSKMLTFYRDGDFDLVAKYSDSAGVPGAMEGIGNFTIKGVTKGFDGKSQKVKAKILLDDHGCFAVGEAHMIEKLPPVEEAEAAPVADAPAAEAAPADAAKADADAAKAKEEPAAKAVAKEEPAKKKAKTTKTTPLTVVSVKPDVLSADHIHKLFEIELAMQAKDREEREKSDAKNALEEYIYHMRDRVSSDAYSPFIKEEDSEAFRSKLTSYEDWLYDEGEDQAKSVYNEKLGELTKVGAAVEMRHDEAESRGPAIDSFQKAIVACRKFVDQQAGGDEKYAHITDEEMAKVKDALGDKEKWLNENTAKLAGVKKFEDPPVKTSMISAMVTAFSAVYTPVMNKPQPKVEPPPEVPDPEAPAPTVPDPEAPKPAEGDAAVAPPAEGDAPTKTMDID